MSERGQKLNAIVNHLQGYEERFASVRDPSFHAPDEISPAAVRELLEALSLSKQNLNHFHDQCTAVLKQQNRVPVADFTRFFDTVYSIVEEMCTRTEAYRQQCFVVGVAGNDSTQIIPKMSSSSSQSGIASDNHFWASSMTNPSLHSTVSASPFHGHRLSYSLISSPNSASTDSINISNDEKKEEIVHDDLESKYRLDEKNTNEDEMDTTSTLSGPTALSSSSNSSSSTSITSVNDVMNFVDQSVRDISTTANRHPPSSALASLSPPPPLDIVYQVLDFQEVSSYGDQIRDLIRCNFFAVRNFFRFNQRDQYFLALTSDKRKLIAFFKAKITRPQKSKATMLITFATTDEKFQRRGIMTRLITEGIKYAKENRMIIKLEVFEENEAGMKLYKKLGFVFDQKVEDGLIQLRFDPT